MKPNSKAINAKYGQYCGMVRKRDFEDKHPFVCYLLFMILMVVLFVLFLFATPDVVL